MTGLVFSSVADLHKHVGTDLGPTEWVTIEQGDVNRFADLTKDHNYIHIDPVAAKHAGLSGTIVHGFFTLSMLAYFMGQANVVPIGTTMGMNYGLNKVRFLQPVPCGARIRARIKPLSFVSKTETNLLATMEITIEIEGLSKPALVAEALAMYVLGKA